MTQYLVLLRQNRNFRFLWWGNVVSLLGDWFNLIASASLISELTNSGAAISYLFLARFIPVFVFSPIAGVIADRFNRKHILIASDLLRCATVFCFLFVKTAEDVWLLYVLTATQFALSALFNPARSALLANIVDRSELVTANALDSFTWSTMLAMGSFAGGVVAALFGIQVAIVMDGLTFVLSAWLIAQIVLLDGGPTAVARPTDRLGMQDGLAYLWRYRFLFVIALVKAGGSLVWGALNVLEVQYADYFWQQMDGALFTVRLQEGDTAVLGLIYVVSGLGTGIGPLFIRRRLGDAPARMVLGITISFICMTVGIALLAAAPNLVWFLLGTFIRTVGTGSVWVFSAAILQTLVDNKYRGRVFSFEFAALTLTQSVSVLLVGYCIDQLHWSLAQATSLFATVAVVVTLFWLLFAKSNRQISQLRQA